MALAAEIHALRDRILADLDAAHDYYTDTKMAWDIVGMYITSGHKLSVQNIVTGTTTTETQLSGKVRGYVAVQLSEATFQQFLSIFENFIFDLLRLWLIAHPQSLGSKQVDLNTILAAPDKHAVTLSVIDRKLNDIKYERPADWFKYLNGLVNVGCPTEDEINRIAEAKASRDVLEHNRGVANKIYETKAGKLARYQDGQKIDIPEDYHRAIWQIIRKMVSDVSAGAIAKAT